MNFSENSPRVIITGTNQGVGKSLITMGLILALRKQNVSVSCCIHGSNLFNSILYQRLIRRYVRCIDNNLLTVNQINSTIDSSCVGSDLLIIDGKNGLYDGELSNNFMGSDAELSHNSRTPAILVIDAYKYSNSIGALVRGYVESALGFDIAGTILNKIENQNMKGISLRTTKDRLYYESIYKLFQIPEFLSTFPELNDCSFFPTSIPSQTKNTISLPRQFFIDLGQIATEHINLDKILEIASSAPKLPVDQIRSNPYRRRCKIAVSEDTCFNLCFHDNIELLKFFGAEIVTFSPLADLSLPKKIGAVYITGGFLNDYGQDMHTNESMKNALRDFASKGGVIFSEGSGTAYLCEKFIKDIETPSEFYEGVGLIKGNAINTASKFEYFDAVTSEESVLGRPGLELKGIDIGDWKLDYSKKTNVRSLKVSPRNRPPEEEGFSPGPQIFGTFRFLHLGSNIEIAKNIVDAAEVVCKI